MTNTYEKIRGEVLAGGALGEEEPTVSGWRAVLGVGIILALLAWLAYASIWSFVFVVGLLFCIFLHEMGHYITAKKSGMKVTQFFMGMGPKLWSYRRGETEYGVRMFPVGAFVRIIGMNNLDETPPEDEDRTYRSKSYPRRMLTITAGSIMHMLIAILLLFSVYTIWGKNEPTGKIAVVEVVKGLGADQAGVQPNDVIVALDGARIGSAEDVSRVVRSHAPGEHIAITVDRAGQQVELTATLGANPQDPAIGYLGIRSGEPNAFVRQSLGQAISGSFTDLGSAAWQSVGGVIKVMNPVNIYQHLVGENTDQATQPVTVVGISRLSNDIGHETGLAGILLTLAGVNVFVGLLNMFPLLPFDGGHAAIASYERVRSRPGRRYYADAGKMVPVAMAVMTFLVFVLFTGLYLDFARPIK